MITSGLTLDTSCFLIVKIANKFSLQMVFICLMTRAAVIDLIEERKKIRVQVWCLFCDTALLALRFFLLTWYKLGLHFHSHLCTPLRFPEKLDHHELHLECSAVPYVFTWFCTS